MNNTGRVSLFIIALSSGYVISEIAFNDFTHRRDVTGKPTDSFPTRSSGENERDFAVVESAQQLQQPRVEKYPGNNATAIPLSTIASAEMIVVPKEASRLIANRLINPRVGDFTPDAATILGLNETELKAGNTALHNLKNAFLQLQQKNAKIINEPNGAVKIAIASFPSESDLLVRKLYNDIALQWNSYSAESIKLYDLGSVFNTLGAGYEEKEFLVSPSGNRPGYFEVTFQQLIGGNRNRMVRTLSAEALAQEFPFFSK